MTGSLHILTGAPGTGKTAVLRQLASTFRTVEEPARRVLAELRRSGQSTRQPPERFVELLLETAIVDYENAQRASNVVVFDRGIPDCAAYAAYLGSDPSASLTAAATRRYEPAVLLLTPWRKIYTTDDERIMTFEMTERFHSAIVSVYDEAGYELVEVPQAAIAERTAFIESHINPTT